MKFTLLLLRRLLLLTALLTEAACLCLFVKIVVDSFNFANDFLALACLVIQVPVSSLIITFTVLDLIFTTKVGKIFDKCRFACCCESFNQRFCDRNEDRGPRDAGNSSCLCKFVSCANGPAIGMVVFFACISTRGEETPFFILTVTFKLMSVLCMVLQYAVQRFIKKEANKDAKFGEAQRLNTGVEHKVAITEDVINAEFGHPTWTTHDRDIAPLTNKTQSLPNEGIDNPVLTTEL